MNRILVRNEFVWTLSDDQTTVLVGHLLPKMVIENNFPGFWLDTKTCPENWLDNKNVLFLIFIKFKDM